MVKVLWITSASECMKETCSSTLYNGIIKDKGQYKLKKESSVQFSLVAQLCPTLCDPVDCSTPGLPVHHQLPGSTQTQVHGIDDAIQPSHPLSSLSLPPFNLYQHQGLFK